MTRSAENDESERLAVLRAHGMADGDAAGRDDLFREIVGQASDAIFIYDLEGRFVDVNTAACALTGYGRNELLRLGVSDIEVSFDPVRGPKRWLEMTVGEAVTMEGLGRCKDGSIFPAEARVSVLETGKGRFILALVRDISQRRHAEKLLQTRARQQQAIANVGTEALRGQALDTLFGEALQIVGETLKLELCAVMEHLPESGEFVVRAGLNLPKSGEGGHAATDGLQYAPGHVLRTGEAVIIEDFATEQRFKPTPWLEASGAVCGLSVAIGGDGSESPQYGVLSAYSRERREFTPDDTYFVQSVANVLAAAIARRRGEDALREVKARYQRIAANTSGMVFQLVMKPDFSVTAPFVSEGCRQLYELEPAQLQAAPHLLNRAVHPDDKENYNRVLRKSVQTLEPFDWQGRVFLPSGIIRWVTARARLDRQPNGDVIWDGVVLDVSELKRAQEEMLAAKEEAERANQAKSEFLSRMSHELRTPLNAILGFGQILGLSNLDGPDSQCVDNILQGGKHLLALIDEVLDLSRVESGELALKPAAVSFEKLARECVGFVAKMARSSGVACTVEAGPANRVPIWADEQRLRQVLLNLLSNAIKYNRVNGQVSLGAEIGPGGRAVLKIRDTGMGISPEGMARLFVPFERLGQEFGEVEGTGLGLVVSRRLVEAMDGSLNVESELGKGTVFLVELPAASSVVPEADSAAGGDGSPAAAVGEPSPASLLYIEDNLSNLRVVKMAVARLRPQWRFLSAMDGIDGLRQARAHFPGVILLDLQLPGLPGDAVLAELQSDPQTRQIPVLLLSADATAASRERLLSLGASGYVSKPFDVPALLERLDTLLLAREGL